MVSAEIAEKKRQYMAKLISYTNTYKKILIFHADNVGSHQMQKVRIALRGRAVLLMGKNTLIRKAFNDNKKNNPDLELLLPHVKGNVGFVFTNEDVAEIRERVEELKQPAAAKPGQISNVRVVVSARNTGMEPTKTSFFQSLNIPTKITRGCVEIISDVVLLNIGDKVGASQATLLQMLDIQPFSYGLNVLTVYDEGSIYSAKILDLTEEDKKSRFLEGVKKIASVGLATGIPNEASVPHSIVNAFKKMLNVAVATNLEVDATKEIRDFLADPSKFASAAPAGETKSAEAAPAVVESSSSSSDAGFGGLF
uniref:60S acidic ribosomal protein P0 n=1 Tax=Percolomonas cosmopolitus TaxID=63605 RepID=A0A7S1KLX1_9EUKA|eukprot:CAMPEP_0117450110 /NCGR_PEP_ID=MMETSP0759-20121206/8295_1 /TAXON_ID=63605 /ORGANISM="Percolomonas cosmopolitus, Strain WS" /LENGTH=309 /DNA_ID=CAMNT_0005242613 /DNA_START=26 /DNA_END=955 /DNA_ORIENTATION=+